MLINNDERRMLLELFYSETGVLKNLDWQWVEKKDIPLKELEKLQVHSEEIRKKRISNKVKQSGKIGRNDSCPCGSGKKFKKCCSNRS
ncbi:SEC-C metal-binding domain-containing protein [Methylomagnum sp.]